MSDPTFTTREELDAWRKQQVIDFQKRAQMTTAPVNLMLATADRIRRVTERHAHLPAQ